MQVKKFEAPTIAEALKLVKSELGPEAIILSTKNNRKGFGLLSNASVEVTAAVSDKALAKKQITEKVVPQATKSQIDKLPASKQADIFNGFGEYYTKKTEQRRAQKNAKAAQQQAQASPARYVDITDDDDDAGVAGAAPAYGRNGRPPQQAHRDFGQARAPFSGGVHADQQALQQDVERLKAMLEELKSDQTAAADVRIAETSTEELHVEYQNLLRNGIDKKFATQLVKQVSFVLPREALKSSDKIVESLAVEMMNGLKVEQVLDVKPGASQKVFALIGPTGVGKTTTIAKLASQAILAKNLRVGLINVDSYKVAAVDQLSTYAKILNVPFRQATNATELDRALTEFKPLDLILIDTSGRSQRDSESLTQMKALLSECAAIRPLLIMSATTRDQELYDIITRFKIFNPAGLIFSKLDETSTFGCIYNVAVKTQLPLTYFTVGQRVPEDIEAASRERVVDLVLDI